MQYYFIEIGEYIIDSFVHTWPYILITIPIAVAVKMSGASKYINRALTAQPILAIFLATLVGAFSPLCSCSVIPVVAALLIGGVPLAPVMSFWLASPSMDPEIFFLTAGILGWKLAIWRLGSTLVLSLGGGFITHKLVQRKWLGMNILRDTGSTRVRTTREVLELAWNQIVTQLRSTLAPQKATIMMASGSSITLPGKQSEVMETSFCGIQNHQEKSTDKSCNAASEHSPNASNFFFWKRLARETWVATIMVIKFMLIAWFFGALVRLYVPETWIITTLGGDNPWSIFTAAILGVPVYTSNLTAMPLIGGLLSQGMHPGAALAFLIAGPTTTLPAMSAVWGLVNRKVFFLYIGFALVGAIVMGYIYSFTL
ncbi:MAG: permease [Chloroflexota bacterium]|nr:MAG: permease [Chloroflexota bacterium]